VVLIYLLLNLNRNGIFFFFLPNASLIGETFCCCFCQSRLNRFHPRSGLTVNMLLFVLCINCGIFLQGHVTALSRTDSETLQDVMIVLTVVEIALVVEIAMMTEVAETMIVEVCSI